MAELKKQANREEKLSSEDYEHLLDKYQFSAKEITPGQVIKGKLIKITPTGVLVDIGFKSEGVIPVEDFVEADLKKLRPGDEIEAILERTDAKEGYLLLSKKKADRQRAIGEVEKAFHAHSYITGKIIQRIKNGYTVDAGLDAFLPDSHADIRPVKNPASLLGQDFKFKVIKFERKTENAVLSRKLFLQDEREKKKRRVFSRLVKGEKIKGHVRSLTSFGAFIDLGGVEGLLHISEMSWGKIGHPSELFETGQEVEVVLLDFNEKDERISLGYKQLTEDPWKNVLDKYSVGQKVKGKVVSLTDFGAFVELEKGIEGLVHISDLSWSRKSVHPKKILSIGEEVHVSVLDVNPETKRVSLGLKQTMPHPLELLRQKYSPGARVKGKITSITDFGAFMEVEPGVEGLIHISDISWEKIKHAKDKLEVGQETEAVILNIDVEKQKVSLGIKQLEGDIWEDFFNRQKIGDLVKVRIVRIADFGVFVEITPGIEGVVFLSELDERKIENAAEAFSVGEERIAKIIKMNPREKRISLSFRLAQMEMQKLEYQKFLSTQDQRHTLGDIMRDQLKHFSAPKKVAKPKEGKK
ncbi:MAG: 30S ribosomal protein S1 [Candidatus Aminicenantes bacterium]|nr:30S ribosomal protein S1 [Candidatus Aminicenantes bacterium]